MQIIVPYVDGGLSQRVREAVQRKAVFVNLTGDDLGYFHLLRGLWWEREPFCIVEQDVVADLKQIEIMKWCDSAWCTCPIQLQGQLYDSGLGCTKIDPNWFDIGFLSQIEAGQRAWPYVADALNRLMRKDGLEPHWHEPAVHLHDYSDLKPVEKKVHV